MLVGPAVGGLLIAFVGIGWCFVVDVAATAAALRGSWRHDARTDEHAAAEREVRRAAGEPVG